MYVAIFLNEKFAETYKREGAPKPLTTPEGGFKEKIIRVPLMFNKYDDYAGKKIKGDVTLFVVSKYHLHS